MSTKNAIHPLVWDGRRPCANVYPQKRPDTYNYAVNKACISDFSYYYPHGYIKFTHPYADHDTIYIPVQAWLWIGKEFGSFQVFTYEKVLEVFELSCQKAFDL